MCSDAHSINLRKKRFFKIMFYQQLTIYPTGTMSVTNSFPRLQSASFEPITGDGKVEVSYKSGASFKGQLEDHKKKGRGIFTWPNGARYEGEYVDNNREGSGKFSSFIFVIVCLCFMHDCLIYV